MKASSFFKRIGIVIIIGLIIFAIGMINNSHH